MNNTNIQFDSDQLAAINLLQSIPLFGEMRSPIICEHGYDTIDTRVHWEYN